MGYIKLFVSLLISLLCLYPAHAYRIAYGDTVNVDTDMSGIWRLLDQNLDVNGTLILDNSSLLDVNRTDSTNNFLGTLSIAYGNGTANSSTGQMIIDNANAIIDYKVFIGREGGDGRLEIRNGGKIEVGNGGNIAAAIQSSKGYLLITGEHSELLSRSGDFYVGGRGEGSLIIEDKGTFRNQSNSLLVIGQSLGSNGLVMVRGDGSSIVTDNNSQLIIGEYGQGSLKISDGASVNITGYTKIGNEGVNSNGALLVTGNGSYFVTGGSLHIGGGTLTTNTNRGAGTLTVTDNGRVEGKRAVTVGEKGMINIGAAPGSASAKAGTLIASKITLDGALNFNQTDHNYNFYSDISGQGHLKQMGTGSTMISGNNQSFIGKIDITRGTLFVNHSDNLGAITGADTLTLNGGTLHATGDVTTGRNVILGGSDGAFMVDHNKSLTLAGQINGSGRLIKNGTGLLILTADNLYTGGTMITAGILQLGDGGVSGSIQGPIINHGVIRMNRSDEFTIRDNISGTGMLQQNGSGKTILMGQNTYTGGTDVAAGILEGNTASLQGQIEINSNAELIFNQTTDGTFNGTLSGSGQIIKQGQGTLNIEHVHTNTGQLDLMQGRLMIGMNKGSIAQLGGGVTVYNNTVLGGYGTVAGDVINRGTIMVGSTANNSDAFGSFTIRGNYSGEHGTVMMGTRLANDGSPTDRLIILGDASGQSNVIVNNIHGAGAQTSEGIEIIEIRGASHAQFDLLGRAVAGAYEYTLNKGSDGHWYLHSDLADKENDGDAGDNGASGGINYNGFRQSVPVYRPEVGSYLANIAAVNSLFTHQLNDRMPQSIGRDGRSVWVRMVGTHGKFNDTSKQLNTSTDNQVVQVGGDIFTHQFGENGLVKWGALFGYGQIRSSTRSTKTNVRARSNGDGYALGLYGTWFQNSSDSTGAYVDSWLQYIHFDNNVKGSFLRDESYKAKGLAAALEAGYSFKLSNNFYLQPQAQITWMNVKAKDHYEYNGTRVRSGGAGNIQTRVGTRMFGTFTLTNGIHLQPYAELNWIHNSQTYYVDMDGTRINQQGAKNTGQFKAGLKAQITQQLNLWGDVSYDKGKDHYRNTKLTVGLKYIF